MTDRCCDFRRKLLLARRRSRDRSEARPLLFNIGLERSIWANGCYPSCAARKLPVTLRPVIAEIQTPCPLRFLIQHRPPSPSSTRFFFDNPCTTIACDRRI